MDLLRNYDIEISKLNLGQYAYHFQIDDKFFELFDYSLIDHGNLLVDLALEKKDSHIALAFSGKGTIELICDRSLEKFDYQIGIEKELILKYGEMAEELSDEIEIIPFNTRNINVARYIYEFISIEIPMKKLHPRYENESKEDQIIYSSGNDKDTLEADPIWNKLKKLKHKK